MYDVYESGKTAHIHAFVTADNKFVAEVMKPDEDKGTDFTRIEKDSLLDLLVELQKFTGSTKATSRAMRKLTVAMRNGAKTLNQHIKTVNPALKKMLDKVKAAREASGGGGGFGKKKKAK